MPEERITQPVIQQENQTAEFIKTPSPGLTIKRPVSVTVISWILMIISGIGFLSILLLIISGELRIRSAENLITLVSLISSAVVFISSAAMLNGRNWGRVLYLFFIPIIILLQISIISEPSPADLIGIVVYLILLLFLTRRVVVNYFKHIPPH